MTKATTSTDDRLKISASWVMVAWALGSGFVTMLFFVGRLTYAPRDDTKLAIDTLAAKVSMVAHGVDRVQSTLDALILYKTRDSLDVLRPARRNRRPYQ